MENKIILTLAVPTYNRRKFLETGMERCVKQIIDAGLEKEVEIIIGNDTSPDNTAEYVNELNAKYSFVRGFNHEKNLGVTKNIEWLVHEARGTHVLIHSDDDLLEDGAIAYFVKSIKEKNPNVIIINTTNILSTDDANKEYHVTLENRLKIHKDIFMENKDRTILKQANDWLYLTQFITAVIFRRDLWIKEMENAKKFVKERNVFLWQAPVIITISDYGRLFLIAKCFVLCRKNPNNYSKDWSGAYRINLYESIEISRLIKHYMPEEYRNHKKTYAAFIMSSFLSETQNGRDIRKFALVALRNYINCFPENVQFLAMAIFPKLVARFTPRLKKYKSRLKRKLV